MHNAFHILSICASSIICVSACSGGNESSRPDILMTDLRVLSVQAGASTRSVKLTSTADWSANAPNWIDVSPADGKGRPEPTTLTLKVKVNDGANRNGVVTVTTPRGTRVSVAVMQEAGARHKDYPSPADSGKVSLKGKKFIVIANSMVYYGGFVQKGNAGSADQGMFYKLLKAKGMEGTVIDCTQGNHYLSDFISSCGTCSSHVNHLAGIDFGSIDYVILSQAGSNVNTFLSDCRALYGKFAAQNPNVRKVYINHVYSVFKNHGNVLGNLKTLHEQDDVTIVNCGQLAYDIYTGKVSVPGGSLTYPDRYTFVNHTSSDYYHPNPLMGYIMTQMTYCALTGDTAVFPDYASLVKGCSFGSGSVSYGNYYTKYYTTPAALPFTTVLDNAAEMQGIQQLIPSYIDKY